MQNVQITVKHRDVVLLRKDLKEDEVDVFSNSFVIKNLKIPINGGILELDLEFVGDLIQNEKIEQIEENDDSNKQNI